MGCSSRPKGGPGLSLGLGPASLIDTNNAVSVFLVEGQVWWQESASSPRQPLRAGALLPMGAAVSSDSDGFAELLLPRGAGTLTLEADSRVVFAEGAVTGPVEVYVARGRINGVLRGDSLRLYNGCGASLQLTPQPGMSAPFSFGSTLPRELWDAMIGLGLNPDVMLPPLRSEGALGATPDTFVAPYPTDVIVPEPSVWSLAGVGLCVVAGGALLVRRGGTRL